VRTDICFIGGVDCFGQERHHFRAFLFWQAIWQADLVVNLRLLFAQS
jgi:hypothetical protein